MRVVVWLFCFLSFNSFAITIDSMIKVANENRSNEFVLKNPDDKPALVKVTLSELNTKTNEELPFDEANFENWPIYAEPSEVIIDSQGEAVVNIISLDNLMKRKNNRERVIGVTFTPVDYEDKKTQMNILLGYKAWYILPKDGVISGDVNIDVIEGKYFLKNGTNTSIGFSINACDAMSNKEPCEGNVFVLSGKRKEIFFDEGSKGKVVITAREPYGRFKKEMTIEI
ncbi:hypothetical protein VP758_004971 [Vibrio harveyi]|nr:hypothetical protein [Vibrio harveyi]